MKKIELDGPPPYLQGVYVRENFDFAKCGSALSEDPSNSLPEEPPESSPEEPKLSAMMSDDDFLNSLLTPVETRPLEITPPEPDTTPAEATGDQNVFQDDHSPQVPWSLTEEQQMKPCL